LVVYVSRLGWFSVLETEASRVSQKNSRHLRLTEGDLDFLVEIASPEVADKGRLKQIISDDEDFRSSFLTDEKVFRRVMDDDEVFLRISPALFFEVLLRKAAQDL
jgi:hypothetical protein